MKYLKSLALLVTVCMMLSVMPVVSFAADSTNDAITDTDATPAPEVTEEPQATEAPEATEEPDVTAEPDATADPEATEEPAATADPDATEEPDASATPSNKFAITVNPTEKSKITTSVTSAASGARITIEGKAARGYNYKSVYYETADGEKSELVKSATDDFSHTVSMPASDIVIYAEVVEMTPNQLYTSATRQYGKVTQNIQTYKSRYINNSSAYSAIDIRELDSFIKDAEKILPDLKESYTYLNDLIRDYSVTSIAIRDVIDMQERLDEITEPMDELVAKMGGDSNLDYYDIDINVTRGGRVTLTGAASGTVDAYKAASNDYFENVPANSSLTFRISTTTGYVLNYFRINGKNITTSGNSVMLSTNQIKNYIASGVMEVTVSFSYNYGGSSGGSYGGGSSYGGSYGASGAYNSVLNGGGSSDYNNNNNGGISSSGSGIQSSVFVDLDSVEWAVPSINALYGLGIVNGMGDGKFEPQNPVTREQFAKMIVGVMGYSIDQSATTSFSDDAGDWYTPYIAAAVEHGIITGRDYGSFGIGDKITRQDIAVIIHRTQGVPAVEIHEFPDSASISDYAVEAVSYLFVNAIASGDDNGNFNPTNSATRAEASKMLYGLYQISR